MNNFFMISDIVIDTSLQTPCWAGAIGSVSCHRFVLQAWLPLA